jgi:omega-amidase
MASKITVAVGQAVSRPGSLEENLQLATEWALKAAKAGAKLLLLPELFDSGYDLNTVSARGPAPEAMILGDLAIDNGIHVVVGMAVKENGKLQNASVHFAPDGGRHVYAKIHLFEAEPNVESRLFQPGGKRALWAIEGIPAGPLLCYDLRFPELARSLCLDGAKILLVSSAWPASRREVFRVLSQSRAIENQCFLLSANLSGRSLSGSFAGASMIVGPDGAILAEARENDELLITTLDFSQLDKARGFLPCFQQRRPDCYRL